MSTEITVIGVYESAAAIGRDLEKLIDAVGSDLVAEVMPKVISVLEQLETCVKQRENENSELHKMQEELRRVKQEGAIASEDNLRLIVNVKELDAQRQKEIRDWMAMATELQSDNQRLKSQLSEKEGIVDREKAHEKEALQVLYQLKETVDAQRDLVRTKDDELRTRTLEVDALQQHVDRLATVTANLRRKNELLNAMAKNFIQEKSELQSKLSAIGKETSAEHQGTGSRDGVIKEGLQKSAEDGATGMVPPASNEEPMNMKGKMIIDLSDPDRPRFTLHELQTVLAERDELKLDVMELEDELEQYRPKRDDGHSSEADRQERRGSNANKNKGEPSGIKKLFSFLFRKNPSKSTSTSLEENTFLEKPAKGSHLTLPADIDQRSRALSGPAPASIEVQEESLSREQRSRSYHGPPIKLLEKNTSRQQEMTMVVRTDSDNLVELGQDMTSMFNQKRQDAVRTTVLVDITPVPTVLGSRNSQPASRNNCNNSNSDVSCEEVAYPTATGAATGQGSNIKVLVDNNENENTEFEV
ncbi:RILP-like protein 1 isoform X1 [Asterias rubens]|uniref:RILP-like protein 1 isoform X1 n=1 Tax=Asterias rubens TaxID=7604 RepID=UPI0014558785|nr:RILP-like protein 1 isoform X1 [Asterias rubens]